MYVLCCDFSGFFFFFWLNFFLQKHVCFSLGVIRSSMKVFHILGVTVGHMGFL